MVYSQWLWSINHKQLTKSNKQPANLKLMQDNNLNKERKLKNIITQ